MNETERQQIERIIIELEHLLVGNPENLIAPACKACKFTVGKWAFMISEAKRGIISGFKIASIKQIYNRVGLVNENNYEVFDDACCTESEAHKLAAAFHAKQAARLSRECE